MTEQPVSTPNNHAPKKRRSLGLEGMKFLIGTTAIAGTLALWSGFSNQARIDQLASQLAASELNTAQLMLPPMPTLVPLNLNGQAMQPAAAQPALGSLRSVTVPAPSFSANSVPAPRVVGGNRSTGGAVTTTRASSGGTRGILGKPLEKEAKFLKQISSLSAKFMSVPQRTFHGA